jgi:hypothetical protein
LVGYPEDAALLWGALGLGEVLVVLRVSFEIGGEGVLAKGLGSGALAAYTIGKEKVSEDVG